MMARYAWLGGLVLAIVVVVGVIVTINADKTKTLRIFIWEEYIDPEVYRLFEREFGAKVIEDNYGSNEDMRAKLQAGGAVYDLVVPSDYMVTLLRKEGLLLPIDLSRIPNLKHLAARFRDPPYDPGHRYSVPYQWGITGIGYNKSQVIPPPVRWADLFEPTWIEPYKNRISMLNDMREVIVAALVALGHSPETSDPQHLAQAQALLLQQKPFLAKYDSESFEDSLASGETVLAQGWSGEIAMAQSQNPDIGFVIPAEGTFLFVDNWAMPKGTQQKELAEEFINFVLRPEISAMIVNHARYASVNEAARSLVKPEILAGPSYYWPEGTKLWWLNDFGDAGRLYERVWLELKGR
jgi:spermidine/putrescine transport system substrate-binding protein